MLLILKEGLMFAEFVISDLKALAKEWGVPDDGQFRAFSQYYELARYIARIPKQTLRVLELGSGFSTALLAKMAEQAHQTDGRDVQITSIDIRFDTLDAIPTMAGHDHIKCLCGTTVTANEMRSFYDAATGATLMNKVIDQLIHESSFARTIVDDRKLGYFQKKYDLPDVVSVQKRMCAQNGFYREILDYYSNFGSLSRELDLVEDYPLVLTEEIINTKWDVIYFDSGELSTNVEFKKLCHSFSSNSLIAFHDVWFPKSFKSWLPATAIMKDPGWLPVYNDETTSQGMFMAARVKEFCG